MQNQQTSIKTLNNNGSTCTYITNTSLDYKSLSYISSEVDPEKVQSLVLDKQLDRYQYK